MAKNISKGVVYSFLSAASFATLAIFVKVGYNTGLSTVGMLFLRFGFAVVLMGSYIAFFRGFKIGKNLLFKAFITGGLLYPAQSFCFFSGIGYTSPNVAELILYLYPAVVAFLGFLFFKEALTPFKLFYIAVILIGFGFIFHDAFYSKLRFLGVLFSTAAMVIYSFYLIVVEKFVSDEDPVLFSFFTIFFAFIVYALIGFNKLDLSFNFYQLIVGFLLGLVPTFLAIMFLFKSIEVIGSSLTSVFSSVEPVVTIILSSVFLHMWLNTAQIIGGVLILLGVFMANFYHLREEDGG